MIAGHRAPYTNFLRSWFGIPRLMRQRSTSHHRLLCLIIVMPAMGSIIQAHTPHHQGSPVPLASRRLRGDICDSLTSSRNSTCTWTTRRLKPHINTLSATGHCLEVFTTYGERVAEVDDGQLSSIRHCPVHDVKRGSWTCESSGQGHLANIDAALQGGVTKFSGYARACSSLGDLPLSVCASFRPAGSPGLPGRPGLAGPLGQCKATPDSCLHAELW